MGNRINVYITADNIISALGFGTEENLEAIRNYQTGISMQTDNRIAETPVWAGTINVPRFHELTEANGLQSFTRIERLAILSIRDVLDQSGVELKDPRCGFIFASTKGNIELIRRNTRINKDEVSLWKMAEKVANYFGRENDFHVISNACVSGLSALIVAQRWIQSERYDRVVVTGADVLSHFITSGFISFKSVSRKICRPYDVLHDGLSLGEGCGTILLSNQNSGNDIVLVGGGISNDANHLSGPSRTGDGLYLAINQAMNEAHLSAADIDVVNAHGTATLYNDEMEAKAIHLAGLQNAPVNGLKSYFGHTLGAAGVIETIICARGMKEQILFGTYGFKELGVSMPLFVFSQHKNRPLRTCIKTASGFGGCNAAIALSHNPRPEQKEEDQEGFNLRITTSVLIENGCMWRDNEIIFESDTKDLPSFIRKAYKDRGHTSLKFFQLSELCKLGGGMASYLLDGKNYEPTEIGIIMSNANSSLSTDINHQHIIDNSGDMAASPSVFVYTLPNVVTGQVCISFKIQGENTFFINKACNFEEMEAYARLVMKRTGLKYCIIAWCDVAENSYRAEARLLERFSETQVSQSDAE